MQASTCATVAQMFESSLVFIHTGYLHFQDVTPERGRKGWGKGGGRGGVGGGGGLGQGAGRRGLVT